MSEWFDCSVVSVINNDDVLSPENMTCRANARGCDLTFWSGDRQRASTMQSNLALPVATDVDPHRLLKRVRKVYIESNAALIYVEQRRLSTTIPAR